MPKKEVALFPHAQPGSDGFLRRFEDYLEFLDSEGISYSVYSVHSLHEEIEAFSSTYIKKLRFISSCAWKRLWQVCQARNYKKAFVQRGLLLYYYDYNQAFFERLLSKLCPYVVIDFWDAVWTRNKTLVQNTIKYGEHISVVNEFIKGYFSQYCVPISVFPIGVNLNHYLKKETYQRSDKLILFYTGQPENVKEFISILGPVLIELKNQIDFKLRIVSRSRQQFSGLDIDYHDFNLETFRELLSSSDIGLYAVSDNETGQAKMAMKVLDYMASGLPCIASPIGLSPHTRDEENIIIARSREDWFRKISTLSNDEGYRRKIGVAGRIAIEKYHTIEKSYLQFKNIMKII